ncbi:MAG: nucleotide exchange factor GrpE [Nitrospirae bacterium]|nr:nucleotide exchange factor GrpE [Nitrospirota bacterium]
MAGLHEEEDVGNEEALEKKEMESLEPAEKEEEPTGEGLGPEVELAEMKDKYLRLYAEFENYKKRMQRDKEELVKYCNESILYEILPVIDNLEMALSHATDDVSGGLVKGVEITLREFQRVMEKFGLVPISAKGEPFDPSVHHAMSQVVRSDVEDKTVVEEYRKGYMFGEKVLRPSLVAVSKKPDEAQEIEINKESEEE